MRVPFILMTSVIMLHAGHALADERALQQALAKAQMMLKQAAAEKLAADQELAKVKTEFDQYKKKSEGALAAREQGAEKLAENVNTLKERYVALAEKYQQLQAVYKDSIRTSQTADASLELERKKFQLCYDNNKKLYDINQEILGNYQDKGFWDVFQDKEPFTGFATVKLETLIQDYQYQNEDLKLDESLAGTNGVEQQ